MLKPKSRRPGRNGTEFTDYRTMLREYQQAALRLKKRLDTLRAELRAADSAKAYTAESAKAQLLLERRAALLQFEYEDMLDTLQTIRFYAQREVRP